MIRIAILGDIGAGKSFVSKQFNCPLFNADKEVAEIYKNDRSCYQKIKKALPKYIISDHLDKKFLLKAVLDSKNNLKKISKIVHPIVRNRMNKFLIKNSSKKYFYEYRCIWLFCSDFNNRGISTSINKNLKNKKGR